MRRVVILGLAALFVLATVALAQGEPGAGNGGGPRRWQGTGEPGGAGGPGGGRLRPAPPAERDGSRWAPTASPLQTAESSESTESTESGESTVRNLPPVPIRPTAPTVTPKPARTGAPIAVILAGGFFLVAGAGFCLRMARAGARA